MSILGSLDPEIARKNHALRMQNEVFPTAPRQVGVRFAVEHVRDEEHVEIVSGSERAIEIHSLAVLFVPPRPANLRIFKNN